MQAKHYLGIGLLLIGWTAGYELFSQKRNQQLIESARDATATTLAFEFNEERERRRAKDERNQAALVEQTRSAATAAVSAQFQKERTLNKERAKQAQQQGKLGALLSEGFIVASTTRMLISEHYMNTNEFPSSNYELDLPPPDQITGNAVSSLEVSWGGEIVISFNQKTGVENGEIILRPVVNQVFGLRWECESRSFVLIEKLMPQCRYTG